MILDTLLLRCERLVVPEPLTCLVGCEVPEDSVYA